MTNRLVSPDIAERAKNFGGTKASSGGTKPPRPMIFEAPELPKSSLLEQAATREDAVVETPASRNRDRGLDANRSGNFSRMSNGTRRSTASHSQGQGQGQGQGHGGHEIKSSGIRIAYDGVCHRVEVIERGSSADLCGLIRKGDVLAKVDGRPAMDIFGMRGSARRVKGPEGSLVVLSLERDMQGMPPMPYEVELFYGTIPPERLMHVLENSTRELEQELELCRAQEELGREIGRKLCMDKDANIVLEGAGSCPVNSTPHRPREYRVFGRTRAPSMPPNRSISSPYTHPNHTFPIRSM